MAAGLKLRAQDDEDLTIISAYLQDAVTVVGDFDFNPQKRIFAMMVNRYLWEEYRKAPKEERKHNCHRIRTGCHFENILKVSAQNIPQKSKSHVLELLAIESGPLENGNVAIDLIFAGDGVMRLEAELIEGHMLDIGDPYPAKCHPMHEVLDNLSDD